MSAALTATFYDLRHTVGLDDAVADQLAVLKCDLAVAVPSYRGLQLVLVDHGHPVMLTAFEPGARTRDIATSLRVPLSVLTGGVGPADPASRITFYAASSGAFVDLAADLSYALRTLERPAPAEPEPMDDQPSAWIGVDDDLIPVTVVSGLRGLPELATINRAIGMLIGDGHEPDEASQELDRRAVAAGLGRAACAAQLVRPRDQPGLAATSDWPFSTSDGTFRQSVDLE